MEPYSDLPEVVKEKHFRVVQADGSTGYYVKSIPYTTPLVNKSPLHTQALSRTQIHSNIPSISTFAFSKIKEKPVVVDNLLGKSLLSAGISAVAYSLFDNVSYLSTVEGYKTVAAYWNPDGEAAKLPSPKMAPKAVPKAPVVPSISKAFQETMNVVNKNLEVYNQNSKLLKDMYDNHHIEKTGLNDSIGMALKSSPFLAGQTRNVQAIDDLTHRMGDLIMVHDESNKILASKLTELVSVISMMAKHSEIKAQASTLAYANDMGDSDFFYSFVPTDQYWHNVDTAGYQQFLKDTKGVAISIL